MGELEKCECQLSVMTNKPMMNMGRQIMGAVGILQVINDGAFVCTYKVYLDI